MHLWVLDQSWRTGRNDSVSHFEVCFCILLTSNWEVSAGRFLNSCGNFTQSTQKIVVISCMEYIETNFPIGKHTQRVIP